MTSKAKGRGGDAATDLNVAFTLHVGAVQDLIVNNVEDFHQLRVYNRGGGDILGVLKRFGPSGDIEVVFGSGWDLASALLAVDKAASAGRWRVDTWDKRQ